MMNLSNKAISSNVVTSPNASNKVPTNLNPNAAEFIPFALRSPIGTTGTGDVAGNVDASGTSGKAVLDRSDSNNSDDEAHQYWRRQLPDDITPDFKFMGEDGADSISFASLSVNDVSENSRFPVSTGSGHILSKRQELSAEMHYPGAQYGEDHLSAGFPNLAGSPWEKRFLNADRNLTNGRQGVTYNGNSQNLTNGRQGVTYNANSGVGFVNDGLSEHAIVDDSEINPVDFLASQFPGFAAESLAEVYYANGYDLNLTIEMLTQLELQVDSGFNPNLTSKTLSAPNLSALDFPALSESDSQNGLTKYAGDDLPQSATPYKAADKDSMFFFKTSSVQSRGPIDFASVVKKPASQDSGQWKYERNGSANVSVGSSRSSQVLASSYHGSHGGSAYGDRLQNYGSARGAPTWLETGEAVANMYSELREEARDYARLRNAYFDQAQQAYISGNKALAKELSLKGQLHNMQMKAAHVKAQESIYRQRNPTRAELQAYGRGQEQMIDLHGLHVSEAIHRLRGELSVLRSAARSADQCLQVYICVGTGHHTKGSRTPARLPVTVEQYLLQEEGLDYTEPQPGLLRVVVY